MVCLFRPARKAHSEKHALAQTNAAKQIASTAKLESQGHLVLAMKRPLQPNGDNEQDCSCEEKAGGNP